MNLVRLIRVLKSFRGLMVRLRAGRKAVFISGIFRASGTKIPSFELARERLYLVLFKMVTISKVLFCAPPNSSFVTICKTFNLLKSSLPIAL